MVRILWSGDSGVGEDGRRGKDVDGRNWVGLCGRGRESSWNLQFLGGAGTRHEGVLRRGCGVVGEGRWTGKAGGGGERGERSGRNGRAEEGRVEEEDVDCKG